MNLLPGVRELRSPLIAGYIWLATTWLLLGGANIHLQNSRIGRTVNVAAKDLGRPIDLAVITLIAYIIGVISNAFIEWVIKTQLARMEKESELESLTSSQFTSEGFSLRESLPDGREVVTLPTPPLVTDDESDQEPLQFHLISKRCAKALETLDIAITQMKSPLTEERCANLPAYKAVEKIYRDEAAILTEMKYDEDGEFNLSEVDVDATEKRPVTAEEASFAMEYITADALEDTASERLMRELPLVLTRMIGKESELYGAIDRLRTEAEFRAAVALPLSALVISGSWLLDWRMALALVAPITLFRLGINKRREATDLTIQAIAAGRAQTTVLGNLMSVADQSSFAKE